MNKKPFLRGPYKMGDLKGYSKYFRFTTAEYNLRRVPNIDQRWAIDLELQAGYQYDSRYKAYQKDLLSLFSYDQQYDDSTPLDLLEQARTFKQLHFQDWWENAVQASYQLPTPPWRQKASDPNWMEHVKNNALSLVNEGFVTLHNPGQWQQILEHSEHLIFLPNDRRSFPDDLRTWIVPFLNTHTISIYTKADESPYSVSTKFVTFWLEQLNIPSSSVTITTDTDSSLGIRYRDILEKIFPPKSCLIAKGIWNYFSLFKSDFPFLFSINSQEDLVRGLLQCAYSPEQPESLKAVVGYQAKPFPDNVSLTGQDFCELSLERFLNEQNSKNATAFFHQREQNVSVPKQWGHHYSGFFTLDSSQQVKQVNGFGENHVYLQGVCFAPQDFTISPLRFNHLIDPSILSVQQAGFLTNFSYFFTENLRQAYNRTIPEAEHITIVDFPFDYMLEEGNGKFYETVPLYHKGYIGSRKDGSLFIGYLSVKQISCSMRAHQFVLPKNAINPDLQHNFTLHSRDSLQEQPSLCLFTPSYPLQQVGQDRINIVAINDQIIHRSMGQKVTIPPVGVVLSFEPKFFRQTFAHSDLPDTVSWNVEFHEDNIARKSELQWMYGGYNLLMLNGQNLVETPELKEQTFRQEGWYLPQSMKTQETQLQEAARHPRLVLGTTEHGNIFLLTISGRTRISYGANHAESVLYSQYLLQSTGDRLLNLINLDGGASAFLEALYDGQRQVLNFPAPSDLNPAGIIRPNSALLHIIRRHEDT